MIDQAKSTIDFSASIPASIPVAAAPLESILCTEELLNRPWRPPDHEVENSALAALVSALSDSPRTILQTLADKALEVLDANSAGLSLLTKDKKNFYWAAISGAWRPHIGGGTPRDFGPCGDVLDRNIPMLFTHWERRYPYLSTAEPLADEGLLVPFYVSGKSVGTIWAIAHDSRRKFDTEDLRLLESMGRFASAAYQAVESIEDLKLETAARVKAEAARRNSEMQMELAHANRVATVGQLSASITHEVSQPIGAAAAYARAALQWLSRQPPNVEEALLALNGVADNTTRAGDILAGIRALVRKAPRQKEPFEVNEAIGEVIVLVQREAQKNNISVVMELGEGLPRLEGDRIQLQQVMLNLINNALQAMSATGIKSRDLVISSKADRDGIVVSVGDSGPGLPANPERIFEAFYTSKPDGLGMGLSICRSIIEAHGGRIWASANTPRGAKFQFSVPARDGGVHQVPSTATGMASLKKTPIISIVDDDEAAREATKVLIRSLGYNASTFASAEEFLTSERIHDTSCLISDVRMPGLSGIDLQDRLVTRDPRMPIIFITGHPEDSIRARAMKAGAVGFLSKPCNVEHLIACLDKALMAA